MTTTTRIAAIGLVAALGLTGCFGGGDDDAGSAAAYQDAESAEDTMAPTTTMAAAESYQGEEPAGDRAVAGNDTDAQEVVSALQPEDLGRMIVFTATITIEVEDVVSAGEQAQAAVAGLGGMLFGQETTTGPGARSVLTIKVPPENFDEALSRLAGVGDLVEQTVFADDVTERVVDLESRITTAEASVERLRAFLETAESVEAVAAFESELLERETELEVMRGQLRTLEDQVALATIVLVLTEPIPPEPRPALEVTQTAYVGHDGGAGCPGVDEITVDEGDDLTVCFEVANTGDTPLGEIEVRDPGLEAEHEDLIPVSYTHLRAHET